MSRVVEVASLCLRAPLLSHQQKHHILNIAVTNTTSHRLSDSPSHPSTSSTFSMMPSTSDDAVTDPFLLSWGSSVNVNEDLRNSIRTEIQEIDASLSNLEGSIQSEQRLATQLAKDLLHAYNEMSSLRRSASGERDSAAMNEQVRNRLVEALRELMKNDDVLLSSATTTEVDSADQSDPSPPLTVSAYLARARAEYDETKAVLLAFQESCASLKEELHELRSEKESIVERIQIDKLVEELESTGQEVGSRLKEQSAEAQRKKNTADATEKALATVARDTKSYDKLTNTLGATKEKHASEELELSKKVQAEQADLKSNEDKSSNFDAHVHSFSKELNDFATLIGELEAFLDSDSAQTVELEDITESIKILTSSKKKLDDALANGEKGHLQSVAEQRAAAELEKSVQVERATNDKIEAETMVAASAENLAIVKEKAELLKTLKELQDKSIDAKRDERAQVLNDRSNTVADLNEQLEQLQVKHDEVCAKRGELEHSKEDQARVFNVEIAGLEETLTKHQDAKEANKEQIEQITREMEAKKEETFEELKTKKEQDRLEMERKYEIVHIGAKMLKKTDKKVKQLLLSNE